MERSRRNSIEFTMTGETVIQLAIRFVVQILHVIGQIILCSHYTRHYNMMFWYSGGYRPIIVLVYIAINYFKISIPLYRYSRVNNNIGYSVMIGRYLLLYDIQKSKVGPKSLAAYQIRNNWLLKMTEGGWK